MQKLVAIFQPGNKINHREQEWINDIFGQVIGERIVDGEHKVVRDNAILFDAFIHRENPLYYASFKGKNAFLVHFLDENYEGYYNLYHNFKGVYRNHWSSVFNPLYVRALPYGYPSGLDRKRALLPASRRPFAWSFTGAIHKSSRPDMARALSRIEPHFLYITDSLSGYVTKATDSPLGMSLLDCQQILLDSVFSPSPMGNINLECGRPYEALECGSIPIVERRLSLDYFKKLLGSHPLPTVTSWRQARSLMSELLRRPDDLNSLQAECMAWWARKKVQLRDEASDFFQERSADDQLEGRVMYKPWANLDPWRYFELMRHHDLPSAARRSAIMFSRVTHGQPWRPGDAPRQDRAQGRN